MLTIIEQRVAGVLLTMATLIGAMQILLRHTIGYTFIWAEQAVIVLVIWAVFVGASTAVHLNLHIRVQILADHLPPVGAAIVILIASILSLGFITAVFVLAVRFFLFLLASGEDNPVILVREAWLFAGMPVGLALMIIRYAEQVWTQFGELRTALKEGRGG